MRHACGALAAVLALLASVATASANPPTVALPDQARELLALLGKGAVGEALPAAPIDDPAALRHLEAGTWTYQVVAGADRGQQQTVTVEETGADADGDATWRILGGDGEVQKLKVTTEHEILKLSQTDPQSHRIVMYRPGLQLEPGMSVGETKSITTRIATYKQSRPDVLEYDGNLEYGTTYVGAYRVKTPAGSFDARLLEHRYTMKLGPAKAKYHSYGFYADGVGIVAEVSEESVSAVLIYRRSSKSARLLQSAPAP